MGTGAGRLLENALETIQPTFPNSALTVRQRARYSSSMGRLRHRYSFFGARELERGYFTGAPGVDWKPPNSFRPSGMVTVLALAMLLPSFAR